MALNAYANRKQVCCPPTEVNWGILRPFVWRCQCVLVLVMFELVMCIWRPTCDVFSDTEAMPAIQFWVVC